MNKNDRVRHITNHEYGVGTVTNVLGAKFCFVQWDKDNSSMEPIVNLKRVEE